MSTGTIVVIAIACACAWPVEAQTTEDPPEDRATTTTEAAGDDEATHDHEDGSEHRLRYYDDVEVTVTVEVAHGNRAWPAADRNLLLRC